MNKKQIEDLREQVSEFFYLGLSVVIRLAFFIWIVLVLFDFLKTTFFE